MYKILIDTPENYSTTCTDLKEIEANNFALALLMPEDSVTYVFNNPEKYKTIQDMAKVFAVSTVAFRQRLIQLKLVN